MFKSSPDSIFLFFRTLQHFLVFFLRDIVMLPDFDAVLPFDLRNI